MKRRSASTPSNPMWLLLHGVFLFLSACVFLPRVVFRSMRVHVQSKRYRQYSNDRQSDQRFNWHILPPAVAAFLLGYLRLMRMAWPWRKAMCNRTSPSFNSTDLHPETSTPTEIGILDALFDQAARNQGFENLDDLIDASTKSFLDRPT